MLASSSFSRQTDEHWALWMQRVADNLAGRLPLQFLGFVRCLCESARLCLFGRQGQGRRPRQLAPADSLSVGRVSAYVRFYMAMAIRKINLRFIMIESP